MAGEARYASTRGADSGLAYDDIVLRGLALDGGLYVPEECPKVDAGTLEAWRSLSYADLAFEVLRLFASGVDEEALRSTCRGAYTKDVFCNAREGEEASDITPVMPIGGGLYLLQLSNGPTLAFKDMAMQFLGGLFEHLLAREGRVLNILGATSGDTGSAAEHAMRGRKGVKVFMLSPHGRMSAFQKAQMYSIQNANIFNIAVRGTFDEAQDIVKAVSGDHDYKSRHSIGAVNSINWARVAAQVVYYFKGWLAVTERAGEKVSFSVPSGNFGDILAGWIAKKMGLPVESLITATNENDVLAEFFETGCYRPRDPAHTYATSSPSMDISKASNFERYIFDMTGGDPEHVRRLWGELAEKGEFRATAEMRARIEESGFTAARSTHGDRLSTIRGLWDERRVLIDPHTADGVRAARLRAQSGVKCLCLETAQAAKFASTIREACGFEPPVPASCASLLTLPQRFEVMDADPVLVKNYVASQLGA